jgi:uncharacterized membrane protein
MTQAQLDRLEHLVGAVLRIGTLASTVILALGLAMALAMPSSTAGPVVIRAGLLVLLATPVARVVASVVDYTRDRDWLFAALTFLVLVIVLGSVLIGARS